MAEHAWEPNTREEGGDRLVPELAGWPALGSRRESGAGDREVYVHAHMDAHTYM